MKLVNRLFPSKKPAIIEIYGYFDRELEERVKRQVSKAFSSTSKQPDGIILLIDSAGGSTSTLATFINNLLKVKFPIMGFVENEAMSAGAELLLSCQYRVATEFAKICFHHGATKIDVSKIMDVDVCSFLVANRIAQEKSFLERFRRVTGQTEKIARVIYRADDSMPPSVALEYGILHEISNNVYPYKFG